MCIAISAKNGLRWQPLAALSGWRPTFGAQWRAQAAHADFCARVAFFDSALLDCVLSAWERDELTAQRDVYKALAGLGETVSKGRVVDWLSDALAQHLTRESCASRAYSLSHLTLVNELTDAIFGG
ncbi:MAG: hypothetical protein JWO33_2388 [Caulobacteraceae bacterium]|nr:hypothetical protein [Caulobacteraceae bacterium]